VLIGQVESGKQFDYTLASGRKAWVHVIRGAATVNGQPLATGDAASVTAESALTIAGTDAKSEILLFDLA